MPNLFWTPARAFGPRQDFKVDWIVLHYTAGAYPGDLDWLARSPKPGCPSAHFYIRDNGDIHQMVRLENSAYHAGITWSFPYTWQYERWRALRPNERSIGIEISNSGTTGFAPEQYRALGWLLPLLCYRFDVPIKTLPDPWRGCDPRVHKLHRGDAYDIEDLKNFRGLLGHGNIHYSKTDPGTLFDWDLLRCIEPLTSIYNLTRPMAVIVQGDPDSIEEGLTYD